MTKEKLTPQEKKRLSYEKDHRIRTGEDDRAWRRAWAHRKKRVNRKYRRKTDSALQKALSPTRIDTLLAGDDETTRELIRKGLTRDRNSPKWGVGTLRDAVESKSERRTGARQTNRERKARLAREYASWIVALERDPEGADARRLLEHIRYGDGRLWKFCRDHREWKERLAKKLGQLEKERQRADEKAKVKAEQKRKWRGSRWAQAKERV